MIATIFARDSHQQYHVQVQFHAKYPLFDSQSDREFTFSYAILYSIASNLPMMRCTNVTLIVFTALFFMHGMKHLCKVFLQNTMKYSTFLAVAVEGSLTCRLPLVEEMCKGTKNIDFRFRLKLKITL